MKRSIVEMEKCPDENDLADYSINRKNGLCNTGSRIIFNGMIKYYGLLAILFTATASAQQLDTRYYAFPFRLTAYNNIVVQGILNKTDTLSLMLHTAATDVTVTGEAALRLNNTKFTGRVDSVQSWGGADNSADYSKGNTFVLGEQVWKNITVWKDKNSGQNTDGKFGINLFDNKAVEINFDDSLLVLHPANPKKIKNYQRFELINRDDEWFIKGTCVIENKQYQNLFLIHSGYGGDLLLDDSFTVKTQVGQHIAITGEKKLSDAYGHVITTKKGVLPLFKLGSLSLKQLPVGFFEGSIGRQQMSILGGDIIKRFNWIIDVKRRYIYLKPSRYYKTAYPSNF